MSYTILEIRNLLNESDVSLRQLERKWKQSGSVEDANAYLTAARRAGPVWVTTRSAPHIWRLVVESPRIGWGGRLAIIISGPSGVGRAILATTHVANISTTPPPETQTETLQESDATVRAAIRALRASPGAIRLWERAIRVARRHGKELAVRRQNDSNWTAVATTAGGYLRLRHQGELRSVHVNSIAAMNFEEIDIKNPEDVQEAQIEPLQESDATERAAVRALRQTPRDIDLWRRALREAQRARKFLVFKSWSKDNPWRRVLDIADDGRFTLRPNPTSLYDRQDWRLTFSYFLQRLSVVDIKHPSELQESQIEPIQRKQLQESDVKVQQALRKLKQNLGDVNVWGEVARVAQRHNKKLIVRLSPAYGEHARTVERVGFGRVKFKELPVSWPMRLLLPHIVSVDIVDDVQESLQESDEAIRRLERDYVANKISLDTYLQRMSRYRQFPVARRAILKTLARGIREIELTATQEQSELDANYRRLHRYYRIAEENDWQVVATVRRPNSQTKSFKHIITHITNNLDNLRGQAVWSGPRFRLATWHSLIGHAFRLNRNFPDDVSHISRITFSLLPLSAEEIQARQQ